MLVIPVGQPTLPLVMGVITKRKIPFGWTNQNGVPLEMIYLDLDIFPLRTLHMPCLSGKEPIVKMLLAKYHVM
jgi:hypothetical protein